MRQTTPHLRTASRQRSEGWARIGPTCRTALAIAPAAPQCGRSATPLRTLRIIRRANTEIGRRFQRFDTDHGLRGRGSDSVRSSATMPIVTSTRPALARSDRCTKIATSSGAPAVAAFRIPLVSATQHQPGRPQALKWHSRMERHLAPRCRPCMLLNERIMCAEHDLGYGCG